MLWTGSSSCPFKQQAISKNLMRVRKIFILNLNERCVMFVGFTRERLRVTLTSDGGSRDRFLYL